MAWKVETVILATGERSLALSPTDRKGVFHSDVLTYTLGQLRPREAVTTIAAKLSAIGRGLQFCTDRNVNLIQRAAEAEFLSNDELAAWATATRMCVDGHGTVKTPTASEAYKAFVDYCLWLFAPVVARVSDPVQRTLARQELEAFNGRTRANRPRSQGPTETGERLDEENGLTPDQRSLFLSAITPGSETNPFRAEDQHRIYAVLLVSYELGPRTGELLALKLKDFKQQVSPATLTIHRRHDDPEDERAAQPVAKTHGRILWLTDHTRDVLHSWITEHRRDRVRYPYARKHGYIFTNHEGKPLGLSGYQKRIRFLRSHVPGLSNLVNHTLRHDRNERLVAAALTAGRTLEDIVEDQIYVNGWSFSSRMPRVYAKQVLRRRAHETSLAAQKAALDGHYT